MLSFDAAAINEAIGSLVQRRTSRIRRIRLMHVFTRIGF
jgi:hypothetical protein